MLIYTIVMKSSQNKKLNKMKTRKDITVNLQGCWFKFPIIQKTNTMCSILEMDSKPILSEYADKSVEECKDIFLKNFGEIIIVVR